MVGWQDIQWKANLEVARRIESVENRIKNGAKVVAMNYYFDHDRRLVRTKSRRPRRGSRGGLMIDEKTLEEFQVRIRDASSPEELLQIAEELRLRAEAAQRELLAAVDQETGTVQADEASCRERAAG